MKDRYTKRVVVSSSDMGSPDQYPEFVALINEDGSPFTEGVSSADIAAGYARGNVGQVVKTGWYSSPPGGAANVLIGLNICTYIPIIIPAGGVSVDRIGAEITTAGTAGAVVRLGIYSSNAGGMPDARLLDAGTIDSTTTGFKELTINQVIPAGLHWLAAAVQVATCSLKCASSGQGGFGLGGIAPAGSLATASVATGIYSTGVSGALLTTAVHSGMETQPARVVLRFA